MAPIFFEFPFKHMVLDNAFDKDLADLVMASFPPLDSMEWERTNDSDIEIKLRSKWTSEFDIPEGIVPCVRILNSSLILKAMSIRFDIPKLVADSYFSGGGLNVSEKNGLLDVHVDGNYHDATGLNRRLNAILYLNPGWRDGWGGEFGLYNSTGDNLEKKIQPLFNRLVIFDTHDRSYHGLPEPLSFPAGKNRKSVILYYYSKASRPKSQNIVEEPHSALWKKRDGLDKRGSLTRDYE